VDGRRVSRSSIVSPVCDNSGNQLFQERDPSQTELVKPPSLAEVKKRRRPLRNVYREIGTAVAPLDRLAVRITERVGTMRFFIVIAAWTIIWLGWNLLAPEGLQFDPPMAFVLWLFISNLIQILLMPLIMVGQNIQGRHAEARSEHDLEVNIKAEQEIEVVLHHLEYQNAILIAMLGKFGMDLDEALHPRSTVMSSTPVRE